MIQPRKAILAIAVNLFLLTNVGMSQDVNTNLAASDSTVDKSSPLITDITLASRMVWRGIDFASSPSIQGLLAYKKNNLEVGAFGCVTTNGNKIGYGNTLETYIAYSVKNFTLTVDDYFFFNSGDSLNNYFEWSAKKTQHFVEARLKYTVGKFAFTGAYVIHTAAYDDTQGVYFEAEYSPTSNLTVFAGGLTDASMLNFQNGAGITNIGLTGKRPIEVTRNYSALAKLSLIASPNYKQIVDLPGVGTNPIYFLVSITF